MGLSPRPNPRSKLHRPDEFFCSNWEPTSMREGTQAAERARGERPGGGSLSKRGL